MNKFYTLAAAALLAVSASAQQRLTDFMPLTDSQKPAQILRTPTHRDAPAEAPAPAKAPSIMDFATDYSWDFKQHLGKGIQPPQTLTFTVKNPATGEIEISGIWDRAAVPAVIDMEAGTLTIRNKTLLGNVDGENVYFYLKSKDDLGINVLPGAIDAESVVGTIDGKLITFPPEVIFTIGTYDKEELGWYNATSRNSMTRLSDPIDDSNIGWTRIGMATLQDGWLLPAFGVDQTDRDWWYQVELQQYDADQNIYRLVDPYRGAFPFSEFNESQEAHGYIEFNVSDPDNVFFTFVNSGFAITDPAITITKFYCYNLTTYFMMRYGRTAAEVKAEMGDDMHYTTFKDGIVHIPSYTVDGVLVNETCWGDQSEQGSGWQEDDGSSVNMETKIFFPNKVPGSVDIINGADNAPVRYFNLQGIEVTNPGPGLYIRSQGAEVTKQIIR